ncbi:MAG: tetratricopeptide repeat protein, partial [Fervidobacterium sp.]
MNQASWIKILVGKIGLSLIRILLLFSIFSLLSLAFAVINEEAARDYLSKAIFEMNNGNFTEAYNLSLKALSGRVFVNELPYFWYLRGKLAIANGMPDKAIEEFQTFLQLVKNDEIENLINKVNYFRKLNLSPSKKFELKYINTVNGIINGIEYFQNPTSLSVYGDIFTILDSKNKRLIYFKNGRIFKIKKVSKNLKQILYGYDGKLYLLDEKSLYDENEFEIVSGLRTPYAAGPDRDGNIIIVDFDRIVFYNIFSKSIAETKLPNATIAIDVEVTYDK